MSDSEGDEVSGDDKVIRVLIICQVFPPESMGGAHRWQKIVEHLPAHFECRVICPPPSFPFGTFDRTFRPWKREQIGDVSVTRLWTYQPTRSGSNWQRILNNAVFACIASIYVILNFWRYDRFVNMAGPHTTFLPGVVAKLLNQVWIIDVFDLWLDNAVDLGYVEEDSVGYRIVAHLERLAFTKSDEAIVLTKTMAEQFRRKYNLSEDHLRWVPFGVEWDLFEPRLEVEPEDRIVYFGNLGEAQAFEAFFQGFASVDHPRELHIAGSGERRAELEALSNDLGIDDRVIFLGMLSRNEIPKFVASSKLSIVPLKNDDKYKFDYARPTKLLESMAVGTPFVASKLAEIEIICNESNAGIAVDNEPVRVAKAIRTISENEEKRREMGKSGVEFIDNNHRWDSLAELVAHVLEQPSDREDC